MTEEIIEYKEYLITKKPEAYRQYKKCMPLPIGILPLTSPAIRVKGGEYDLRYCPKQKCSTPPSNVVTKKVTPPISKPLPPPPVSKPMPPPPIAKPLPMPPSQMMTTFDFNNCLANPKDCIAALRKKYPAMFPPPPLPPRDTDVLAVVKDTNSNIIGLLDKNDVLKPITPVITPKELPGVVIPGEQKPCFMPPPPPPICPAKEPDQYIPAPLPMGTIQTTPGSYPQLISTIENSKNEKLATPEGRAEMIRDRNNLLSQILSAKKGLITPKCPVNFVYDKVIMRCVPVASQFKPVEAQKGIQQVLADAMAKRRAAIQESPMSSPASPWV